MNTETSPTLRMATELKLEDVKSVYSGKPTQCCCGCSGTHSEKPVSVKRILGLLQKVNAGVDEAGDEFISAVIGNRLYIAYLAGQ